jgi:hypothetical protein
MDGNRGINYRALGELFRMSDNRLLTHKYSVFVSVMEIYNENVRDLLCAEQGKKYHLRCYPPTTFPHSSFLTLLSSLFIVLEVFFTYCFCVFLINKGWRLGLEPLG